MSKPKIKLGMKTPTPEDENTNEPDEFYSLHKMNDYIKELVENNVFFMFTELLKKVGTDYADKGLSFEELKERYLSYFKTNMKNSNLYCEFLSLNLNATDLGNIGKNTPTPKDIEEQHNAPYKTDVTQDNPTEINTSKCRARTSSGAQCSRKKQPDSEYCGSHSLKQPYGRIDLPQNAEIAPKKRGRPPTHAPQSKVIKMSPELIDGITYIVDEQSGNVYTTEEPGKNPEELDNLTLDQLKIVGKKQSDGSINWYSDNELRFM